MKKIKSHYYIIWGGIAGLSAAVFLIQDWKINGKEITIFEKAKKFWWALDAKESNKKWWYIMRWVRLFVSEVYVSTLNFMSKIPSLNHSGW
jgi:oleate hydratase